MAAPVVVRFIAIIAKARALDSAVLDAALLKTAHDFINEVREVLKEYPAPVPNTFRKPRTFHANTKTGEVDIEHYFYERTGDLGEAWEIVPMSRGGVEVGWRLENHVHERRGRHRNYAVWVQGAKHGGPAQAWFHRDHHWVTTDQALDLIGAHDAVTGRGGFQEALQRTISRHLKTAGLTSR